ncbi:phytanoyl-CoA dioxygenase family protein [Streptomyces nogalater]|uniref:Phytanoyl-CoA dioxygenase family protein n=1 Tax=Streptomyces nogalater TaxID=38314 RepID=Q9RN60_STRNO|nr:SnoK [Streptomyces nogalater]WBU77271.1 SnoK [Cosmid vector pSnogaori_NGS]
MPDPGGPTTAENLSKEAVRFYREQGYVHIPRVLSETEVTAFRAACEEVLEKEGREIWGAGEDEVQVHYVAQAWQKHPELRSLVLHPEISGIALRLAGAPLRVYSSDILVKEPKRTLPTLVHDDETGLPLNELSATLTAWIALTDVPVERGCMSYVPGSHLRAREDRQEHMTSFAEFRDLADVWPDYPWQPRVAVPVRAGDVVFHHCRTVHMAEANTSDSVRMAHGVVYMDADATYRPGVQDGHLSRLSPGDPLEGELFPLVTAGTRQ